MTAHRQRFRDRARPQASAIDSVSPATFLAEHKRIAVEGIPRYRRYERSVATELAHSAAAHQAAAEQAERHEAQARVQAELDDWWEKLSQNDPETVLAALERAFSDNEAPALAVECAADACTVVVLFWRLEAIPERRRDTTPTGRPTLKKRTKTERNEVYAASLASHVLATVRESFAVAPALRTITVVALRPEDQSSDTATAIYVGTFQRAQVEALAWERLDPLTTILQADGAALQQKGRTSEVVPLSTEDIPELEVLLSGVGEVVRIGNP